MKFEDDTEGVIFNHYSFCEIIKHIMVQYGNITYQEADKKLKNHFLIEIPKSKDDVEFLGHELEFHWAMHVLYGDMYWTKGIPSDFNNFKEEYLIWEAKIRVKHNLKKPYLYYEIEE
ncbi:hypothetical protein ACFSTE_13620 [Aquimarina hainanensis]|uniref:Uncharacterized protein n=1 Tax=Aquimarina hainanensis TaxID=1578017 RepID=A0ABW5NBR5_9FLAO